MNGLARYFELSRGGDAANVRPMEGLRGFAVLMVFVGHYITLIKPWIPPESSTMWIASDMWVISNVGVDLFFVLSGYLIYGSLIRRPQPFLSFMSRRVERLYPTFVTVFLLYLCLSFAFPRESKIPSDSLSAAAYLVANFLLLPGLFPIEPMISVAWSLSYELFYYLTIPFAIEVLRLRDVPPSRRALGMLWAAVLFTLVCAVFGGHVRLVMFLSGILLFEAMHSSMKAPAPDLSGLLALVIGMSAMLIPVPGSMGLAFQSAVLFVAFFWVCFTCFSAPSGSFARSFSWTPMRWLGNISYSYYLIHGLTVKAAFFLLAIVLPPRPVGAWFFWALMPLVFIATLITSVSLFLGIERPFSLAPSKAKHPAPAPVSAQ
jgi:exopolysaccharide production protein ExoZ